MNRTDPQVQKLGEVLEQSLKRLDPSGKLTEYGVWPIWNDTVGALIARNAQPERIRNGTLFVSVTSSTWMQQLQYMKEMIAQKLNDRLGKEIVKTIFFVVGKRQGTEAIQPGKKPLSERRRRAAAPIDETRLQAVRDPETRTALKRLFENCSKTTKRK